MLTISDRAIGALETLARPGFAADLREYLANKYPQLLPRFPPPVQARIVANMLERASAWGLDRQDSLTAYCEFMIVIAPNFDEEPEIRSTFDGNRGTLNLLVPVLPDMVGAGAWERAEAASSSLPLFVSHRFAGANHRQRSAQALKLALHDRAEAAAPDAAIARAEPEVAARGLDREPDGLLALAACHSFYGAALGWLDELARDGWSSGLMMEGIRLRLALDFGRYL